MAAILVMAAIGAWAVTTGRISYVVTYGVSMNPVYYAGDLVIVGKADSYEVGQIAAYYGAGGRTKVLHRIIGGDAQTGWVFKGDNNQSVDRDTPTSDEVLGRAILHVPTVGTWLQPLLSPTGIGTLAFLFVGGGTAHKIRNRRDIPRGRQKKRVKHMSGQGGSWAVAAVVVKAVTRLHPGFRVLTAVAALAAVAGVLLGVLGWMRPVQEAVAANAGSGESITFSYSAKVPRTAAYDGTRVYSPEPIYRNVVDLVDLQMTYRGDPGRIGVSARLSTSSGWHTTMRLSQPSPFTAKLYNAYVQLDLDAFDERAKAATEAIGAEVGALTATIIALVQHDDGTTFEAQLPLSVSALGMNLAGGAESLVVNKSSGAGATVVKDRQIGAFGYDLLTAAQARKHALFLLLLAVAGSVIVAVAALRSVPLNNRANIERRYPHLLVPVEPMPSPPGKPVVVVDSFPALVKLAEKYGQMILTWTRPDGADDFVVRDDGVTYRYRIVPAGTPQTPPAPEPAPVRRPPARRAAASKIAPAQPAQAQAAATPAVRIAATEPEPVPSAPADTTQEIAAAVEQPRETAVQEAPKEEPRKRARRPRKKAEEAAKAEEVQDPEDAGKPPLQRPIRLKPEAERKAMETLAELNQSVGAPEPETPHEPIYDFLPKHQKDQADGATGR
ncbi:hypothetical protein ACTI_27230 [Actinoplanes sp. OR16]|uniref:DUF5305 family protein n=1 Tax=Actinoplanes sp. OR16 TaxID=946334 RepID=UPI000F71D94E|nr:DUF5305 family protein [Actinoplanes sp. OR16]BBH66038.1 hypothetical protein ACTI_27230 [Actinoplanes sp. OR16]